MSNRDRLDKAIDKFQRERTAFIRRIERLEQVQLNFKASRNSWSVGQLAHHVGLAESVWGGYIKSVVKKGDRKREATLTVTLEDVPFSSKVIPDFMWRNSLVLTPLSLMANMVPRPLQEMLFAVPIFKMEAGPRMQPKHGMTLPQILKYLDDIRRATLDAVGLAGELDLSRFRIVHPLVGSQDIYGVMALIASHDQRHAQQIDSIKKSSNFPVMEAAKPNS